MVEFPVYDSVHRGKFLPALRIRVVCIQKSRGGERGS